MTSAADAQRFKKIVASDPECKHCFECGAPNPQWCAVNHAVFVCLECSGVHRSLGVHLSFVRSSTMDGWTDWKPENLRKMEIGGNRRARLYFESNGVPQAPIKARYETLGALRYAAMLEAEAAGQPFNAASWQPPDWYARMKQAASSQPAQQYVGYGSGGYSSPTSGNNTASPRNGGDGGGGSGGDWLSTLSSGWNMVSQTTASADLSGVKVSISRGWSSVASTVSFYASDISQKLTQQGEQEDGLSGLRDHARMATDVNAPAKVDSSRLVGIGHTPSSPSSPSLQHQSSQVAAGWGSPVSSPQQPTRAWGVTRQLVTDTSGSPTQAPASEVLSGKPIKRRNSDDWGWDDV